MCSPISSASAASQVSAAQNSAPKAPTTPAPAAQKQDSVHLSAAALAASGDVDHDGDSH
jgi:hypothetical protein